MSHVGRILLAAGSAIVAVLIILLSTGHVGPRAQMDVFVADTIRTAVGQEVVIEQYVPASQPRRLQRDMIKGWFRPMAAYSMTQPLFKVRFMTTTEVITTFPVEVFTGYAQPLPYPPGDLWCVRVQSTDPLVPKVLLLALHQDMYTARWVVHEPTDVEAVLETVGCHFANQ